MRKSIFVIAAVVVVAAVASYALSPYLTESEIYEELPDTVLQSDPQGIIKTYGGTFVGVNDGIHNAEGSVTALAQVDGSHLLRLENFHSTNGPDLYVYLSTDKGISDFVDLGPLKANQGNQNYDIPMGTDLDTYDHVLVWCRPFGVLFGSAQISEIP